MQTIRARWYAKGSKARPRQLIVVHDMEAPNKPDTAEGIGRYFAALPAERKASAHVGCDVDSRCRYVDDDDIAYAAPGANNNGLHIELAGYARYQAGEWTRSDMVSMIKIAAQQIREWCDLYGIPVRFVRADGLRRGEFGITTHYEVSQAWRKSDHTDPGKGFPINLLLEQVHALAPQSPTSPDYIEDDDVLPYFAVNNPAGPGFWLVKRSDGGVFAYDNEGTTTGQTAPHFGALPGLGVKLAAPIVALTPYIVATQVRGYWLLGADGGVFALGAAPYTDSYAAHAEWHGGERDFVGLEQHGDGYDLIAIVRGSDPPCIQRYDLSVKR